MSVSKFLHSAIGALSLVAIIALSSCDGPQNQEICKLTGYVRPAWYDTNPETAKPAFSVATDPIRLHFFGWNLEEDSTFTLKFPENTDNYRRAILTYRMGGWNQGPADWDMTTQITFKSNSTGEIMEISRCFTPYGGSFGKDWSKTYYMDITEYLPHLTGETEFYVYYGGWDATDQKAHTATLTFDFYEGTAPQKTVFHKTLYESRSCGTTGYRSWCYGVDGYDIEAPERLGLRTIELPQNVKSLMMRVAISGHGHDQGKFIDRKGYRTYNAAEFDENFYTIILNGESKGKGHIFYENSTTYPQAGTYKYDRANWGPGLPLNTQWWTIENLPADRVLTIDLDLDRFVSQHKDPNAEGVAQYIVWVDLFGYDK